ncbi:MAG: hypothetical protein LUF32_06465 [Clostridiales bacterium]|nr:hypothetical protein [Clostridiales bacterium]
MTTAQLTEKGAIWFDRITEGIKQYADVKLVMDEKKALSHFKCLKKEYGAENAFADFYYFRLDFDSREMVEELLDEEEIDYLRLIAPAQEEVQEDIIFPLSDKLLRIIVKLNDAEMLFSTIYFVQSDTAGRPRTSWWGNYEKEYICFRDR